MTMETALAALLCVACALLCVACALLAAALLDRSRRDRELVRLARALEARDPASNARLTLAVRSPGLVAVARATNRLLDAEQERRIADERARAAFQQDLASLSHDIRTPLAGAQGYLQLADLAETEAERDRALAQAARRLVAMRELVDGLFEYAKAADPSLALELRPMAVAPALADALAAAYPQFEARGWEPEVRIAAPGARALAEEGALARVLGNLVTNALRYGVAAPVVELVETGGDGMPDVGPAVAAGAGARDARRAGGLGAAAGTVRIRVSNKVSDPAAIDADRLFDRFYRGGASRSGDGSGLGLAIVARLVGAMGGTAAASLEGDVLTVEVTLHAAG